MKIVPATLADSVTLCALDHSRVFSAHWSVEGWQAELAQPTSRVWCAQEEGKIVGFVALRGVCEQYELLNLAVAQAYSRRGIARALVRTALDELAACGAEQISLEVSSRNAPAQGLYRSMGFTAVGVRRQFYPDGADALIMEQKL